MIHLISTIGLAHFSWIPQFVGHYRALGVDRFWLTLHVDPDQQSQALINARCGEAQKTIAELGIATLPLLIGKYSGAILRERQDPIQKNLPAHDWVIRCDADEFQVYPYPFKEFLAELDRQGTNAVSGEFLDRIAMNGKLKTFDSQYQLWAQYPIACNVTARVLRGYTHKVAALKAHIEFGFGNHEIAETNSTPVTWARDIVAIHHFKWDQSVLERLAPRLGDDWKQRRPWWVETQRFVDHISTHGRIDLESLDTYRFENGLHRQNDAAAWKFVRRLRENNKNCQHRN